MTREAYALILGLGIGLSIGLLILFLVMPPSNSFELGCAVKESNLVPLRYSIPEPEPFMFYDFYKNPQWVYWSRI